MLILWLDFCRVVRNLFGRNRVGVKCLKLNFIIFAPIIFNFKKKSFPEFVKRAFSIIVSFSRGTLLVEKSDVPATESEI